MILSIIIPQYKEEDKVVKRLLSSIDYQLNVNWDEVEVLVVNDGSDVKISKSVFDNLDNIKHVKYIELPQNVGPGLCRQAGLDRAQGEYVTFCDADDMYQNYGVISLYMEEIRTKHPDIIQTQWVEEVKVSVQQPDGTTRQQLGYTTHDFESTWMHGKCFRKQFLTDNNICFSNKLLYHEDSYILSNAFEITDKVDRCSVITYVWTFDEKSITRRNNGAYSWESIPEFIRAIRYSIDWLRDRTPQKIPAKVVQLSLYIYYMLQTNQNWSAEVVKPIEDEIAKTVIRYEREFNSLDRNMFSSLDLGEHQKVSGRPFIMTETFAAWINRVLGVRRELPEFIEYRPVQTGNNIITGNTTQAETNGSRQESTPQEEKTEVEESK